jgi:enamine deaminase RidA (YjgF/YER057c/UK114 family)
MKPLLFSAHKTYSSPRPVAPPILAGSISKGKRLSITRIHPGPRMSAAVVHGGTVYLSGQVASDAAGQSVTAQTTEILRLIDGLLQHAGTDKTKLLQASIFLADIATFPEMNAVWDGWVAPGNPPCRTTIEAKLAAPQYTVEIAVIAAR